MASKEVREDVSLAGRSQTAEGLGGLILFQIPTGSSPHRSIVR